MSTSAIITPQIGMSWHWQLDGAFNYNVPAQVFNGDINNGFDPKRVKEMGGVSICYINVGALEDGDTRDDAKQFPPSVLGKSYPGWPERFLDIRSPIVRNLMINRFQFARSSGCDCIEPDNTELPVGADTGFNFTEADVVGYLNFISSEVHKLGMSVALKNNGDFIKKYPELLQSNDFAIVEACVGLKKCALYNPFISAGKAVFNVEYTDAGEMDGCMAIPVSQVGAACQETNQLNFEGYSKDCNLGAAYNPCQSYDSKGLRAGAKSVRSKSSGSVSSGISSGMLMLMSAGVVFIITILV
ncbi:hypothetical protein HDV05_005509 [Chytridiales sp. JEL 0842]|nr:hypothetical protein HDV05_005509 [Chytridiales sp. JEL 0842]